MARQYILVYMVLEEHHIHQAIIAVDNTAHKETKQTTKHKYKTQQERVTHSLIEKCVGLFRKRRSHRSAMDFDGKYFKE